MKVIAVANKKGGSGKTTSAVNLAAALARTGNHVLLADLDTQAHTTIGLGINPRKLDNTIHHLLAVASAEGIEDCVRITAFERLSLLPANQDFDVTKIPHKLSAITVLRDSLKRLSGQFDVVVVDSPPSLDLPMYNTVLAANFLLIPFQPGFLNFEGVGQMLRVLFKAALQHRHKLELLGVLPVMLNPVARMHRQILKQALEQFGKDRVFAPIRRDIKLEEAFMHGMPGVQYAPHSVGSHGYVRLAQVVATKVAIRGQKTEDSRQNAVPVASSAAS